MTLLGTFVRHELRTQLRSRRFQGVGLAYVLLSLVPAVAVYLVGARGAYAVNAASFSAAMEIVQPLLAAILAGALSVDAIAREREEGSLGVISLAPLSGAGYVTRRWVALLAILLPLTLLPSVLAYAIAAYATSSIPPAAAFAVAWIINSVLPAFVAGALMFALGTITSRTVLALVIAVLMFTFGLGLANDVLAYARRHVGGVEELLLDQTGLMQIEWALRGYSQLALASAAPEDHRARLEISAVAAIVPLIVILPLFAASSFYVRRSRPDLRPWRIAEDHPLRSFLRLMNRLREEYSPDATREWPDLAGLAIAVVLAALGVWVVFDRHDRFLALAGDRYAVEEGGGALTPVSVVPLRAGVVGTIGSGGTVRTTTTLDVRNDGAAPVAALVFAANAALDVVASTASDGTLRVAKRWQRIDVALEPPLAPGTARRLVISLAGVPADFDFYFKNRSEFSDQYNGHLRATTAFELSDLSRSERLPRAFAGRFDLEATDLMPVLRYSPWKRSDAPRIFGPNLSLTVDMELPPELTAVDSCGTRGRGRFRSSCVARLRDYQLRGGRFGVMTIAPGVELAYLPPHRELVRAHAPALAGGVTLAREAWPAVPIPNRLVFFERPMLPQDRVPWFYGARALGESADSSDRLVLIGEHLFASRRSIERGDVAAALLRNSLRRQRRVVAQQEDFFDAFYFHVASGLLGGKTTTAVVGPNPGKPDVVPVLENPRWGRMQPVLADLEYRVGTERLLRGVEEFVGAGPEPGTPRELLAAIERSSGVSLQRMYDDYFVGKAIPVLTLEEVSFRADGRRWVVDGVLRNKGTGEAFCPVVLRTAAGPVQQTLRADSRKAVSFRFEVDNEPRTLQLDPEQVAYRHARTGTVLAVDYRGAR